MDLFMIPYGEDFKGKDLEFYSMKYVLMFSMVKLMDLSGSSYNEKSRYLHRQQSPRIIKLC
jgi:hypothetical protein